MTTKLPCSAYRADAERIAAKLKELQREMTDLSDRCAHDETRVASDYQDPKPYRVCLGCGKALPMYGGG